jgi:kynurenine formamidase
MNATNPSPRDSVNGLAAMFADFDVHDLSHTLEEGIPTFPTHSKYYHLAWPQQGDPATMYQLLMHEHNGTHVDAPAHYIAAGIDPGKHYAHQIATDALIGPAAVIDLSQTPPALVGRDVIDDWQAEHGPIAPGEIAIFNFGWHRKWAPNDAAFTFLEPWPGLARGAAEHLLELGVKAVGTDCLGLDRFGSEDIPAHDTLLANGVLIMENLAHLDELPERCFLVAAPLKIFEGSGSPIRALALVPKQAAATARGRGPA